MGTFSNDKLAAGSLLGQAQVLGVQATGRSRQFGGGIPEQKVRFDLLGTLDGRPPYRCAADRFVPLTQLAQFGQGVTFVAVWVDRVRPASVDFMIQVGNAAPPQAYQYLFPGSRVPVRIGPTQLDVVIDWRRVRES